MRRWRVVYYENGPKELTLNGTFFDVITELQNRCLSSILFIEQIPEPE